MPFIICVILHILLFVIVKKLANHEVCVQSIIKDKMNANQYNEKKANRSHLLLLIFASVLIHILCKNVWIPYDFIPFFPLFYIFEYAFIMLKFRKVPILPFLFNIATFSYLLLAAYSIHFLYLPAIIQVLLVWEIKTVFDCQKLCHARDRYFTNNQNLGVDQFNQTYQSQQQTQAAPQSTYSEPCTVTEVDRSGKVTKTVINRDGTKNTTTYNQNVKQSSSSYDYDEEDYEDEDNFEQYEEDNYTNNYYEEEEEDWYEEDNNYGYSYEEEEDDYDDYYSSSNYEDDEDTRQQFDQIDFANTDFNTFDWNDVTW